MSTSAVVAPLAVTPPVSARKRTIPTAAAESVSEDSRQHRPQRRWRAVGPKGTRWSECKDSDNTGASLGGNGGGSNDGMPSPPSLLLLDLGRLVRGTVLRRPSLSIRSPYVADVCLLPSGGGDDKIGGCSSTHSVLAHASALDVGGLCSPGATVYMTERSGGGKTTHSIDLVASNGPDGAEGAVLVGAHPRLGERLAEEALRRGLLEGVLGFGVVGDGSHGSVVLRKQVTYGDSRVDFELIDGDKRALVEVKNVVCADFAPNFAPAKTGPNHCVIPADSSGGESDNGGGDDDDRAEDNGGNTPRPYRRTALFPWGRVGQIFKGRKVVSERAIKHLRNLVDVGRRDRNIQPVVLFVVNRYDCESLRPCHEACPIFASELKSAAENGVRVVCFRVRWSEEGKAMFDGFLPVKL